MLNNGWSRVLPASESDTLDDGGVSRLAKLGAPAWAVADDAEVVAGTPVEAVLDEALLVLPHAASVAPTMPAKAARDTAVFIFGIVPILLGFPGYLRD